MSGENSGTVLMPANSNQVGGHNGASALLFRDGKVYKPTTVCPREAEFYRCVLKGDVPEGLTPHCYGFEDITDEKYGTQNYVIMQDVTKKYKHPCVLDLKIGTQTWDADCTPKKLEGHKKRDMETTTATLGFRFCGMKVWSPKKEDYERFPKNYGWTCFEDAQMISALRQFFLSDDHVRVDVIEAYLKALPQIREFVSKGLWTLYASSVLFVYEGDTTQSSSEPPSAFMIDFAHSWKHEGEMKGKVDTGYLVGLDNIIRYFKTISDVAKTV